MGMDVGQEGAAVKLKERRPSANLPHDAFAVERCGKFVGVYQSPVTGVRVVKDDQGQVVVFDDKQRAELVACRRLHKDLNDREPIRITKEFVPAKRRGKWLR